MLVFSIPFSAIHFVIILCTVLLQCLSSCWAVVNFYVFCSSFHWYCDNSVVTVSYTVRWRYKYTRAMYDASERKEGS